MRVLVAGDDRKYQSYPTILEEICNNQSIIQLKKTVYVMILFIINYQCLYKKIFKYFVLHNILNLIKNELITSSGMEFLSNENK